VSSPSSSSESGYSSHYEESVEEGQVLSRSHSSSSDASVRKAREAEEKRLADEKE
jgi:hypothetical protein